MNARLTKLLLLTHLTVWGCTTSPPGAFPGSRAGTEDGSSSPEEEPSVSVTHWSNGLELFMEYPVLRAGEEAKFAVHLTRLVDFQPVGEGPMDFRFIRNGVTVHEVALQAPDVPGIFGPTVTFAEAGEYILQIQLGAGGAGAALEYGPVKVLEQSERAVPGDDRQSGQTVTYLKEQQWKLPFATALALPRDIHETFQVPAEIKAKLGLESVVTAAVGGRYLPPEGGLPDLGSRVHRGDLLGFVELLPVDRSDLLDSQVGSGITWVRLTGEVVGAEAAVSAAEARLRLAEKEAERVSSLVAAEALPARRLDEVQTELEIRKASLRAARQSLSTIREALSRYRSTSEALESIGERFPIHAPISGQVVESRAIPGQPVEGREMLFRVADVSSVWVEGQVFENDMHRLESLIGGTLALPGVGEIPLERSSLVFIGSALEPTARVLPIVFETDNRSQRLKLGARGVLDLKSGISISALAVPKAAVLLEGNRSVVYIQLGGESFERRMVRTGAEDENWVEIVAGLDEEDRVVTLGAYDVALAAKSTEVPEHGHVH